MQPFETLIPITLFVMIGFVLFSFIRARQGRHAAEMQAQLQQKMLDRFSNSQDLIAFLQTPEGRRYLDRFTEAPVSRPVDRTLGSVRTGIIVTFIGAGLLVMGALLGYELDENAPLLFGLLAVFLGAGFLVSAFASHRLALQWGLLDQHGKSGVEQLNG